MIIYKYLFLIVLSFISVNLLLAQSNINDIGHLYSVTNNLLAPVRIAIDNNDNIYVTDFSKKCINKYDNSGTFVGTVFSGGNPTSIAINSDNTIYFGDGETGRISKLNSDGTATEIFSSTVFPSSMVFGSVNNLYIVDSQLKCVFEIDTNGSLINTIGSGTLILPVGIAFDSKNSRILVTEHGGIGTGFNLNAKIWKFDLHGSLLGSFGSYGVGNGNFYRIQGIAINKCGKIFIPDSYQAQVSVFDENESFVTLFGNYGDNLGQLNLPLDIAIDSQERIIMASTNNGSLEIFNIKNPTAEVICNNSQICDAGTTEISVVLTGESPWSFTYTRNGVDTFVIDNISQSPYLLNVADTGLYEIVSLTGGSYAGSCIVGNADIKQANSPSSLFGFSNIGNEVSFVNNSTNSDTYFWDFGDGFTSTEVSPVHTYQTLGEYVVSLTVSNAQCSDNTLTQTVSLSVVGVNKLIAGNAINIFPNPSQGILYIENSYTNNEFGVNVYNVTGQRVFSDILDGKITSHKIDLSNFSKGVYYIQINSKESVLTQRLVLSE